jgi:hypothetical protein
MRQPCLMKFEQINEDKKCLLSEVVSNISTYLLSALQLGPKNPIQFVVGNIPEKLLQALKIQCSRRT